LISGKAGWPKDSKVSIFGWIFLRRFKVLFLLNNFWRILKSRIIKFCLTVGFISSHLSLFAQSSGGSYFQNTALILGAIIIIGAVIIVSENLLQIEVSRSGIHTGKGKFSLFPTLSEWLAPTNPDYVADSPVKIFKKGHDIKLEGSAEPVIDREVSVTRFAVQPNNFRGIAPIPKLVVDVGDEVLAGDPLFFDKKSPRIKYVAPVSGEIVEINRGPKRAIHEIVILADKEIRYRTFEPFDLESKNRDELVEYLAASGLWPHIVQRPFDVVAEMEVEPENIFVSTFDTAPLAPDLNLIVEGEEDVFQRGLDVLRKLTDGEVHLGLSANGQGAPSPIFMNANGVKKTWFKGPHPCGNVGVQIHHIDHIGGGEKVWTLDVQAVLTFGRFFTDWRYDASRVIAITGAEVQQPRYVATKLGASIEDLLKDNLNEGDIRFISGDVLSGKSKEINQYINFNDDQLTVIREGREYELFGWLLAIKPRPTVNRSFPAFLFPDIEYRANTNTHGEKRAFVMTGEYERLLPMDIYVQHLMKAILANDYERMEGLGIYELSEEDVALCEFACTSKQPLQQILRKGLEMMREQT
jgi:Na+-transporting NADH:ubiquinone oxidoreductase subunit A